MILRLVGLPVKPDRASDLEESFAKAQPRIVALPNCHHVSLLRTGGDDEPDYLTLSIWTDREDLEAYRRSDLFKAIWPPIRDTLRAKPWAHTYDYLAGDIPDFGSP